jgi:nitrogen fixation protein FixH
VTDPTAPNPPDGPGNRKRAWLWPGIIIGILGVHTIGCLIVVYIATSDPSHAVVPDYHNKAVAWDQQQAQARASLRLGWTCTIETSLAADMFGQRTVRISLRDADDKSLTEAEVKLRAYHHARANDVSEAEFKEGAPGEYVATVDMKRPGLWGFDVEVIHGDDNYTTEVDQQVGPTRYGAP